ncbi:hypothetical protein [Flindersiella endophytica]
MTFTDYIVTSEANYRIERRLADAENHRLLRRLRRARKAAAALAFGAKTNQVPRQRKPLDKERPEQERQSTKAEHREAA